MEQQRKRIYAPIRSARSETFAQRREILLRDAVASASAKALDPKGGSPFQANVTGLNPTEVTASS